MISGGGERFKVTVFGESHGPAIGCSVEGCPANFTLDLGELDKFMARRAPGRDKTSTTRLEADKIKFLAGVRDGNVLEGTTLAAVIENTSQRSSDYDALRDIPRPGHVDYAAKLKYGSRVNLSGGGAFSGRLTAPICIAGGIAKQILKHYYGTEIEAEVREVGGVSTLMRDPKKVILEAKRAGDSVGGIVNCCVYNFPAGIGGPLAEGLECKIAQAIFSIPAVKGLEFGIGFRAARLRGSQNNDEYFIDPESKEVETVSNYAGGLLGGISSGLAPISFNVAFKPTPSISKAQSSVNMKTMEEVNLKIRGRHDPCIVLRALPVVEAAAAISLYDAILSSK